MVIVADHIQGLLPDLILDLVLVHTQDHIQGHIQEVVLIVGHGIVTVDQEVLLEDVQDHVIPEVGLEAIQRKGRESTRPLIIGQNQPVIQLQKINKFERK